MMATVSNERLGLQTRTHGKGLAPQGHRLEHGGRKANATRVPHWLLTNVFLVGPLTAGAVSNRRSCAAQPPGGPLTFVIVTSAGPPLLQRSQTARVFLFGCCSEHLPSFDTLRSFGETLA